MDRSFFKKILPEAIFKNYVSDTIEAGFTPYGPTLSIAGTLMTQNKVILIDDISLEVVNDEEGIERQFGWFAFRPHRFGMGNFQDIDLKMASKFTVTPNSPYEYNILFSDRVGYSEMNPLFKRIREEWEGTLDASLSSTQLPIPTLFENFMREKRARELLKELEEKLYWKAGAYSLKIKVASKTHQKIFETEKSFLLVAGEIVPLKQNAATIMADLCRQPHATYNFIYPKLS
jgi:hypothetical protein